MLLFVLSREEVDARPVDALMGLSFDSFNEKKTIPLSRERESTTLLEALVPAGDARDLLEILE